MRKIEGNSQNIMIQGVVEGDEMQEMEKPPTDPWLLALWKKGIKPREKEGQEPAGKCWTWYSPKTISG